MSWLRSSLVPAAVWATEMRPAHVDRVATETYRERRLAPYSWGESPLLDQELSVIPRALTVSVDQGLGAVEMELLQIRPALRQSFTSCERTLWFHELKKSACPLWTPPEARRTPLSEPLIL